MAEALAVVGVVASVAQLADYGFKLSVKLFTFSEAVYSADKSIKNISNDVSLTSTVLKELSEILNADDANHVSDRAIDAAQQTVTECLAIFEELDRALDKSLGNLGALDRDGKKKLNRSAATLERLKWPFKQTKMDLLRSNLDRLKASLTLMLQVLSYARELSARKANEQTLQQQKSLIAHLARSEKANERAYFLALRRDTEETLAVTEEPAQFSNPFSSFMVTSTTSLEAPSMSRGLNSNTPGRKVETTASLWPPVPKTSVTQHSDLDSLAGQLLLSLQLLERQLDNHLTEPLVGAMAYKRLLQAISYPQDILMDKVEDVHMEAALQKLIDQLQRDLARLFPTIGIERPALGLNIQEVVKEEREVELEYRADRRGIFEAAAEENSRETERRQTTYLEQRKLGPQKQSQLPEGRDSPSISGIPVNFDTQKSRPDFPPNQPLSAPSDLSMPTNVSSLTITAGSDGSDKVPAEEVSDLFAKPLQRGQRHVTQQQKSKQLEEEFVFSFSDGFQAIVEEDTDDSSDEPSMAESYHSAESLETPVLVSIQDLGQLGNRDPNQSIGNDEPISGETVSTVRQRNMPSRSMNANNVQEMAAVAAFGQHHYQMSVQGMPLPPDQKMSLPPSRPLTLRSVTYAEFERRMDSEWSLDRVLDWLADQGFSGDWQDTFELLDLHGTKFLEIGRGHGNRGNIAMMHQIIYPKLQEIQRDQYDSSKEREEGKRLRSLVRSIVLEEDEAARQQYNTGREDVAVRRVARSDISDGPSGRQERTKKHEQEPHQKLLHSPPKSNSNVNLGIQIPPLPSAPRAQSPQYIMVLPPPPRKSPNIATYGNELQTCPPPTAQYNPTSQPSEKLISATYIPSAEGWGPGVGISPLQSKSGPVIRTRSKPEADGKSAQALPLAGPSDTVGGEDQSQEIDGDKTGDKDTRMIPTYQARPSLQILVRDREILEYSSPEPSNLRLTGRSNSMPTKEMAPKPPPVRASIEITDILRRKDEVQEYSGDETGDEAKDEDIVNQLLAEWTTLAPSAGVQRPKTSHEEEMLATV